MVEQGTENPRVGGSIPPSGILFYICNNMKQIIYVSIPEEKKILIFTINKKGKIFLLETVIFPYIVQPITIKKNFLYAGLRPNGNIIKFTISQEGKLINPVYTNIKTYGNSSYLKIDKYGKYLFSASYEKSSMTMISLKKNGNIKNITQIIKKLHGCHSINIDPSNNIVFIPALLEDSIYLYYLDNINHKLVQHPQKKINTDLKSGPRHMEFHPYKRLIYSINELNGKIDVWSFDKELKNILHKQSIYIIPKNFTKKIWLADIHITPNGKYLYTSERSSDLIITCKINKNGTINNFVNYNKTAKQIREFSIEDTGKYLIAASQKEKKIITYKINKNGNLNLIQEFLIKYSPLWVITYIVQ